MAAVDPARRLVVLRSKLRPQWARAFAAATEYVLSTLTLDRLTRLLERGDEAPIYAEIDRSAELMALEVVDSYTRSAQATARFLDRVLDAGLSKAEVDLGVVFDVENAGASASIRENKLRLIREYTGGQRQAARDALEPGIAEGLNPRTQARRFRDTVSLTKRQGQAVHNYRALLQSGSATALKRRLRDRRFDSQVKAAIAGKAKLTAPQIDKMVARYRERYIKHRSEVIARTEALRSANEGSHRMYQQAIEQGNLNPEGVVRTWLATGDDRTRDSHSAANGQRRGLQEPFQMASGALLNYPGDPSAPAAETVQCRCTLTTRIEDVKPTKAKAPDHSADGVERLAVDPTECPPGFVAKHWERWLAKGIAPAVVLTLIKACIEYQEFGLIRPKTGGGREGTMAREAENEAAFTEAKYKRLGDYRKAGTLAAGTRSFFGSGYEGYNKAVRARRLTPAQRTMHAEIHEDMRPLKTGRVVYRGERKLQPRHDVTPGEEFVFDEQPFSTSLRTSIAGNFGGEVLYQLRVPKGKNAVMSGVYTSEREILFPIGTRARVLEVIDQGTDGVFGIPGYLRPRRIIIMDVLKDEAEVDVGAVPAPRKRPKKPKVLPDDDSPKVYSHLDPEAGKPFTPLAGDDLEFVQGVVAAGKIEVGVGAGSKLHNLLQAKGFGYDIYDGGKVVVLPPPGKTVDDLLGKPPAAVKPPPPPVQAKPEVPPTDYAIPPPPAPMPAKAKPAKAPKVTGKMPVGKPFTPLVPGSKAAAVIESIVETGKAPAGKTAKYAGTHLYTIWQHTGFGYEKVGDTFKIVPPPGLTVDDLLGKPPKAKPETVALPVPEPSLAPQPPAGPSPLKPVPGQAKIVGKLPVEVPVKGPAKLVKPGTKGAKLVLSIVKTGQAPEGMAPALAAKHLYTIWQNTGWGFRKQGNVFELLPPPGRDVLDLLAEAA